MAVDDASDVCDLYDSADGRRFRAKCESTGRKINQREGGQIMQNYTEAVYIDPSDIVDMEVKTFCDKTGRSYEEGLQHVKRENPALWAAYDRGDLVEKRTFEADMKLHECALAFQ